MDDNAPDKVGNTTEGTPPSFSSTPPPAPSPPPAVGQPTTPAKPTATQSTDQAPQSQTPLSAPQTTQPGTGQSTTPPPMMPEVTTPKEKKSPPVLFIVLVVVILLVWGVVAYHYFTNQNTKKESDQTSQRAVSQASPTPEPTPAFNPEDIEIINGSVYQTTGGDNAILVNKDDYPGTGIAGFATVSVSADNSLLCFSALPPALKPALYYSSIDGTGVIQVGASYKNCTWSNDNSMIAYINDAAADAAVDIFKYDLGSSEEANLTKVSTTSAVFRRYEINGWSDDDTTISCNYQEIDPSDTSSEVLGNCEINVETSEVTDL